MRLFSKLIFIPIAALVIVFAVANRKSLTLELWPLPFAVDLPIYLAVLGALVVGILIGGSVQWMSDIRLRRRARVNDRKASALARDLSSVQDPATQATERSSVAYVAPARTLMPRFRMRPRVQ